jgi:hypothetical protein
MARHVFNYSYDRKEFDAYVEYDGTSTATSKTTILKIINEINMVAKTRSTIAILLHKFDVNTDEFCNLLSSLLETYRRSVVVVTTVDKSTSCANFPQVWTSTTLHIHKLICLFTFVHVFRLVVGLVTIEKHDELLLFLLSIQYIEPLYIPTTKINQELVISKRTETEVIDLFESIAKRKPTNLEVTIITITTNIFCLYIYIYLHFVPCSLVVTHTPNYGFVLSSSSSFLHICYVHGDGSV